MKLTLSHFRSTIYMTLLSACLAIPTASAQEVCETVLQQSQPNDAHLDTDCVDVSVLEKRVAQNEHAIAELDERLTTAEQYVQSPRSSTAENFVQTGPAEEVVGTHSLNEAFACDPCYSVRLSIPSFQPQIVVEPLPQPTIWPVAPSNRISTLTTQPVSRDIRANSQMTTRTRQVSRSISSDSQPRRALGSWMLAPTQSLLRQCRMIGGRRVCN